MKRILILLVLILSPAAHADSPQYKSRLNHTRVYNAPKPTKPEAPSVETTNVERKSLALTADKKAESAEETAADRVWKKYKSIAMGEKSEKAESDAEKKETVKKPKAETTKSDNKPSKAGFAAILDSYQTNKQSQRDMRSLSFKQPKAGAAESLNE